MGRKIPERISCGNVKSKTIGRIDSCVFARLPRKKPTHRKINAPNIIVPYRGKRPPIMFIFKSPIASAKITES